MLRINPLPSSDAVRKKEDLFSSVLSQFKKYHPSGNLKFNYLGIFQSLKFAYFNGEKNLFNFSYSKFHSEYFGLLWFTKRFV